jgi:fermentation-respiration switch protein FrsA (DUF1100 family)
LIVMAHGLTGTRRDRLGPFAERFSRAGVAALVFDHRDFGDSTGEPDHVDPAMQLEGWRAAIAYARALPGIDADRIATFGSWLGGGNALAAAVEDLSVSAAISQVPFLDRESQAYRSAPHVQAEIERGPRGELRTYSGVGHFDIYDGAEHEAVVADEVEFLRRHLRPTA